MENLKLVLRKKENPYKESSSIFELWGEFRLLYNDELLMDVEWDLTDFIRWFIDTKEFLKKERFPFHFSNSIAESRDVLFEKVDDFSDSQEQEMFAYVDHLSEYFTKHYLHLKGTNTQEYYIGITPEGYGEISCYTNNEYHAYLYDMDVFIKSTESEIEHFLKSMDIVEESKDFFKEMLTDYYPFLIS
ncbi:hypothetical protein [uncultured Enterococcus sp.]|uniref:hypothetical protein n=1 Tax=uncultured Enterococcus sp. TaxID=167972 RepID=UPI002AA6C616|nr:hypothetical protein [uncultured Enterococcus sp.]